jgi:flagellar biosynthesis protein FlhB
MKEKRVQEKNKGAGTESRAALYTAVLIVVAFAVIIFSSFLLPGVQIVGMRESEGRPNLGNAEVARNPEFADLNSYFTLRLVLSVFNTLLAVYLLFMYVRNYLVLKSSFTLGIVAFLFSFLLYALSSIPIVHGLFGPFGIAGVFSFVPMLFSAIGLIIFAKLSNE